MVPRNVRQKWDWMQRANITSLLVPPLDDLLSAEQRVSAKTHPLIGPRLTRPAKVSRLPSCGVGECEGAIVVVAKLNRLSRKPRVSGSI